MLQPFLDVLRAHWREAGAFAYLLLRIWLLGRQKKWLRRLLELEQQRHIASQNETVKMLSTVYASGEEPTLDDLLNGVDRDWSLRSSQPPSVPRTPTMSNPRSNPGSGLNLKPRG